MTVTTNSRLAGTAYLLYIAAGIGSMAVGASPIRGVLAMLMPFCAIALGVSLYALTRHVSTDLALLGMACRIVEAAHSNGEIFFAVGSTIFCWLFFTGRLVPRALSGLGLVSSAFLVILLTLQSGGLFGGKTDWSSPFTWAVWLPLLIFELSFAGWLLVKGVATVAPSEPAV